MTYRINIGDALPQFKAQDQEGNTLVTEDFIGTPVVFYFYPKDDTPGCTKEACSFRDNMNRLMEYDVAVVGISPDNASSHQKFIEKHQLDFTLLTDEDKALCSKFDVLQEKNNYGKTSIGVERTTFLVDRDGIIQWIERPVKVEGHVDRVIEAVQQMIS
ncbi:MAG: thioredoxin-dependent thiol peroxidase [Parachlamydia sp.]|nr:thioredoxin-dependent thiol peroxidase [Parachlamydia sp.]